MQIGPGALPGTRHLEFLLITPQSCAATPHHGALWYALLSWRACIDPLSLSEPHIIRLQLPSSQVSALGSWASGHQGSEFTPHQRQAPRGLFRACSRWCFCSPLSVAPRTHRPPTTASTPHTLVCHKLYLGSSLLPECSSAFPFFANPFFPANLLTTIHSPHQTPQGSQHSAVGSQAARTVRLDWSGSLQRSFSKRSPCASSTDVLWELVGNAESQALALVRLCIFKVPG